MYYAHFGLNEAPFRITPNTDVFFAGANRGAILDALTYAISQGEGIVKVTGEVGTGKTMLCNMLQSRLPPNIETVYLAHPSVSPDEILHAIAFELQLDVARDANRIEVMHALYGYLLERHAENKQVVIFVEESQNMPIATLEEVRLLSNLETGKHKLLQIVLFGQPELDDNLRQPNIRQLRERITHSFALPPFSVQEVGEYLMFRMRAVGYRGPDLFNPGIVKRIAQGSAGLTRRINLIADKALLAAFSENTHTIEPRHVSAALRDSEFARDNVVAIDTSKKRWLVLAGVLVLVALIAVALLLAVPGARLWTSTLGEPAGRAADPTRTAAPAGPTAADAATAPQPPRVSNNPATGQSSEAPMAAPAPDSAAAPASATDPPIVAPVQHGESAGVVTESSVGARPEPQPVTARDDLLAARISATRQWLSTEAPQTLSIQLLGSENPQQLREHLSTITKSVEANSIFVYRTLAKQKPFLTVLYGSFASREAALAALDRLPSHLKAFKPYLRTVQGIREEMSRNNTL
ncbi:MAG: general secretion pathway protein [Betaproteobacteria bacterium]|nr:MAG: general secretion pathway protein [Betaproteobacteria bacterium]